MSTTSNDKKRHENPGGDEEEDRIFKSLRSCPPDLKIVIKYTEQQQQRQRQQQQQHDAGDSAGSVSDEDQAKVSKQATRKEKEYMMYSQHLARLSNFVDTSLSVNMQEKTTKKIVFYDVTPEIFELAMKLQEPVALTTRPMATKDALMVAEFYDKYGFTAGLKLCDHVLAKHFANLAGDFSISSSLPGLDLGIDAMILADKLSLKNTETASSRFMNKYLNSNKHVTLERIKKLHPLMKKASLSGIMHRILTKEEFESPLFPKFFMEYCAHRGAAEMVHFNISTHLSGTGYKADGFFSYLDTDWDCLIPSDGQNNEMSRYEIWAGAKIDFQIKIGGEYNQDWIIAACDEETGEEWVLWRSPGSSFKLVPPEGPWYPVHEKAKGKTPKIEFGKKRKRL